MHEKRLDGDHEVQAGGLRVLLSSEGQIAHVEVSGKEWHVTGGTDLAGCVQRGQAHVEVAGETVRSTRVFEDASGRRARVDDTFAPTAGSVRWEVEIASDDPPWSTPIQTKLSYPIEDGLQFWMPWAHPTPGRDVAEWRDPLVPQPFEDRVWESQFPHILDWWYEPAAQAAFFAIPLFTALAPADDQAVTVALSPEDVLLDLSMTETADGSLLIERKNHRIGGGNVLRFALDLTAHPADPRGALGWMAAQYPAWFEPGLLSAEDLSGCGAYSGSEEPVDAERLRRMAFAFNWKCSEDFPYMGLFLPPVGDDEERWQRALDEETPGKGATTSRSQLDRYAQRMKDDGLRVLSYFNVTEFGRNMAWPLAADADIESPTYWTEPSAFMKHEGLESAVLMTDARDTPTYSNCYGALIVDPGDPRYREHLLVQARLNCTALPAVDGICIDRTDWLSLHNWNADDGATWVDGRPARSLSVSWQRLADELIPLMHDAGKVVFVNNCAPRIDVVGRADGVYCEADTPTFRNLTALTCVNKPATVWTSAGTAVSDALLQQHLHLGVFPTAPYPHNNHTITPSPGIDDIYLAYGHLFQAMRRRRWVLEPHCIETRTVDAKVNLFAVPDGYVAPVTFGANASEAVVLVRGIEGLRDLKAEVLLPGAAEPIAVRGKLQDSTLELRIPLARGCAMVRLSTAESLG
jgi:hypothetical protein